MKQYKENYRMAPTIKKPDIEATTAYIETWNASGGLLTQAQAARMLNVVESHISNNWENMNLEKLEVNGKKWITFHSVYKEYLRRVKENKWK